MAINRASPAWVRAARLVLGLLLAAAAPSALGQATCSANSNCVTGKCCNTLATSPSTCVTGPFVDGVQVCGCAKLKGLACPAEKPFCCGSSDTCVADLAECPCMDSNQWVELRLPNWVLLPED
ncbi:hypothetical protein Rsub_02325 [Raphidocelis subcapitata]|uniref:Granulins domain-containing protein n=1 Tax=Raphidocelis subcapitata TaxID=307507 RepID=A0A2V0NXF5_9CHLO|nr:hypothetical protein Rsub_02325 [Raphidocelis subcapitata]|eukprot:GBF89607.1 hypothetical protein Rsub_02325 [Raphidocelis subcapitata]